MTAETTGPAGTTWHLEVDDSACIGSGMCAALAPQRFALESATANVVPGQAEAEPSEVLLDAADSCPMTAITVTDTSSGTVVGPRP
ncbi:ferredoxin [Streptomyces sp. NPDC088725]|uniref:ferredoxin n=1 Tax=Streptomyces sp. NPDC088725 TaxID=3365873 RepID=UPI0037F2C99D